jgi:hypothetical protein
MGNTSQSGTASPSKKPEINSQQIAQIYEQSLRLLSLVIIYKEIDI